MVKRILGDMRATPRSPSGPVIGTDINHLFRLLDARPFKRTLAASTAELALIVSDHVYTNLVCRYPSLARPDDF